MSFKVIMVGAALVACAVPAAAQQRGTVEFGAFASAGTFNKSLTLNRGVGGGGHVGVYLSPRWAIEFEMGEMDATRTLGLANVNVGILSTRLVATPVKAGPLSLMLGAGAGGSTETNFLHSYGVNALVGSKLALGNSVALRVDAISDWLAHYDWKAHQRVQVGLAFYRRPLNSVRTVEVPTTALPCNCLQRPDSVSAAEQERRRNVERDYANLRDSLARIPAPVSSVEAREAMEARIHFAFDKADLTDSSRAILDRKVAVFRANPTMTIVITGHAGNMGTEPYNEALGTRRAEAAKAYLVSHNVDASRIAIDSKGEMQPVVSPTAVGIKDNAPNRRDMFWLVVVPDVIKKP